MEPAVPGGRLQRFSCQRSHYEVQKGDTLSKIAKQHYGDANKYPQNFEANKPMLKHPNEIYPGQRLRIPPVGVHA